VSRPRIYPFDMLILIYMLMLSVLILIAGRPIADYYVELLQNAGIILLVIFIIRYAKNRDNKIVLFFRLLYPVLLFTIFYRETGGLMHLIYPGFLDSHLTAVERTIMGGHPTIWLDKHLINIILTEILSLTYFLYYPLIPFFLLLAFFRKRYDVIERSLFAICLTFFICYMIFFIYPIEGPRYYFVGQYIHKINGIIFRPMVEFVQAKGSVHGGAMPSSHFGVAFVILLFCLKYFRKEGLILLPVVVGLGLGTFYGRYHYVSDVVVGGIIGGIAAYLVFKYYDRWFVSRKGAAVKLKKDLNYVS